MFRRIYLDHAATTPIDKRVVDAMLPYLTGKFGNPSSIHFFGQEARSAVDNARHQTAALIGADPNEITFTSGGTESNNLAIRGLAKANHRHGSHIVTTSIEHPAVKNVCEKLGSEGFDVTWLPVNGGGLVEIESVREAIRDETILISVMMANNEIGTIQPVNEIGDLVRELRESGRKIWFHTDAVQAVGKVAVNVRDLGCDLLSFSGHKLYAPKGIGALFVRKGVRISPLMLGGHQERDRRGGTESVANIVALGAACEIASEEMDKHAARINELRNRLEGGIVESIPEVQINGATDHRLPNISNVSFRWAEGEALLINLDMNGIAVSTGSACSSGSVEPSPVIIALGRDDEFARGAIRFSLGTDNTKEDIDRVLEVLPKAVEKLRELSPHFQSASGA